MRTRIGLFLWLLGILFPLGWLRSYSGAYRRAFDALFGAEWLHILMHLALYAGLVILVLRVARRPADRKTFILVLVLTLGVGAIQEGLQIFSRGEWWLAVLPASLFDLGIDLLGTTLGFAAMVITRSPFFNLTE